STLSETNPFENISSVFQSYFAGPSNLSTAVYMTETNEYNGLAVFIVDILKQTPVIQFFFQDLNTPTSPVLFNGALYGHFEKKDQIIPLTGQGYLYFGLFFAPILSIFILYISMYYDKAIMNNKNKQLLAYYLLGTIIAVFSINVYNLGIFIRLMIQYVLPLYILIKFNTKKFTN
ncbi:hypothetical protein HRF87_25975, partial [Bacillus sp. CRN 9]|nr:hypothetical protein [Bacillus sp. CRN 9]